MDKVVLLADPESNAWDFAERIQDYIYQEKKVKVPLGKIEITNFRNGEYEPCISKNVRKKDVYFISNSSLDPCRWWVDILLTQDASLRASANSFTLVAPDMYWSRQDRKEKPHVPISAKKLVDTISPGLERVITMDLHADQIQGFYPEDIPLDALRSFPTVVKYLQNNPKDISNLENLIIASPDAGGVERAKAFSQRLKSKYPVSFVYKRRDNPGEIGEMIFVGEVKDKDVLIVDDIIDSGKTLYEAGKLLREHGAKKLYCYGTHGLFTEGTEKLLGYFERIMTSNTHYQPDNGIEVIDVSPVFAEAIYRAQKGESISGLFK